MIRLAISAANADGAMNSAESAAVTLQAKESGAGASAENIIEQELRNRRPLAEVVAGVTDAAERATRYVLAFTVIRADEQVSGTERIYLAQLANLLDLDPQTVGELEKDACERIDAVGDQVQLGG